MTFLPIVARELRVAARRRGTYWLRSAAAGLVILIGTWFFLMMQSEGQPPREIALGLFWMLTSCAALYSLFSGVRGTADCLSAEKREGTLGLLFLTDLKGYDVVFGKLAASSVSSIYAIIAVVPVLAVPVLMGGLTLAEFGRMALVVLNALFFSLTTGVLVSSVSRSAQRAAGMTLLLILLVTAGLPWCGELIALAGKRRAASTGFLLPSVGFTYFTALDNIYRGRARDFWESLLLIHGMGWFGLLLASIIAPRSWQDRPSGLKGTRWRERWQAWTFGTCTERAEFRDRLLDENPFLWLAARARFKPALVWGLLALAACIWLWGLAKFGRDWLSPFTYLATALLLNLFLRTWFAGECSRQLAEERKAGTLELLLSTTLSVRDILRGQRLALQRQFLGPVLVLLVLELVFMFAGLPDVSSEGDRSTWLAVWPAGMVMLVADLAALYWVGSWQGLTARTPTHASSGSLVRIFVCPWVGFALVMLAGGIVSLVRKPLPEPGWQFFLGLWLSLGLAADFGFAAVARHKLLTEFRLAAQQRFTPRIGFWKRVWPATAP